MITLEFYTFDTHPNVITLVNTRLRVLIFYTFETNPDVITLTDTNPNVITLIKSKVLHFGV